MSHQMRHEFHLWTANYLLKMISKVSILCTVLAICSATIHHGGLLHSGASVSGRQQDGLGNYAFGYDIVNGVGATNSRAEVGDAWGNKKGSYTLTDIDGRARRVDYVADKLGFRAAVKTNEPGTAASAPAAAVIASPYEAPIAPVDVHHLGVRHHAASVLGGHVGLGHHGLGVGPHGFGIGHHGLGVGPHGLGIGHHGLGIGHHGLALGHHGIGVGLHGLGAGHHGLGLTHGVIKGGLW